MNKLKRIPKNILITIAPPVLVFLLFFVLTRLVDPSTNFGVGDNLKVIIYNTIYSGFIALAVSYNLTSGRFDFSVGSVLILSLIVGGNIAKELGLTKLPGAPIWLLLCVVVVGMVCGLVSGVVYVVLKLPPMVTSLGVAMIFEAIGFALFDSKGVRFIGQFDLLVWNQNAPWKSAGLMAFVLIILIYLLNFTKFGYNCRSLQTGQKNAVEVGVNENINSVVCYIIAGALMGLAGIMYLCQYGYIAPQTGLSSNSFIMGAFLPMFIGQALAPYSDRNIGTLMGAFCQASISSGLVALGCSSSMKTVMDGVIVLLFLVYTSNSYKVSLHREWKKKKEMALAELASQEVH